MKNNKDYFSIMDETCEMTLRKEGHKIIKKKNTQKTMKKIRKTDTRSSAKTTFFYNDNYKHRINTGRLNFLTYIHGTAENHNDGVEKER